MTTRKIKMDYIFIVICICSCLHLVTSQFASNVTVETGTDHTILCSLSGPIMLPEWRGPPSLTLYALEGSPILNPALSNVDRIKYHSNYRDLIIQNVEMSDEGKYQCSVTGLGDYTVTLSVTLRSGCSCSCKSCTICLILDIISLIASVVMVIITCILCRKEIIRCSGRKLRGLDILVITINCVVYCFAIAVSVFGIVEDCEARDCDCGCSCKACLGISIADIVVLTFGFLIMGNYIYIIKTGRFFRKLKMVICCVITFALCIGIICEDIADEDDQDENRRDDQEYVEYIVIVHNESGSTSETAYIIITGSSGSSGKMCLMYGETIEEGKTSYKIRTKTILGNLQKCTIGHEDRNCTWNPTKITIKHEDDSVHELRCTKNMLRGNKKKATLPLHGSEMSRGSPDGRSTAHAGKLEEATQLHAAPKESFEMEDPKSTSDKTKPKKRPQPPPPGINPDSKERASAGDVKLLEGRPVPPITSTSDKTDKDKKTRGLSSNFDDKQQNMPNDQHQSKLDSLPPADKPKTLLKPLGTENKTDTDDDEKTEHDTMSVEKKRKKKKKKKSDD